MNQLTDSTVKEFGKGFIEKYFQNGFASMPKREVDILVFHLLCSSDELSDLSIYQLSTLFKISESKVKGLILEGSLRHGQINHKAIIGKVVDRYISNLQSIELIDGYCEVSLEDPIEKREFQYAVRQTGHHVEFGINRDILKIRPIQLLEIILENVENGEIEFINLVKKHVHEQKKQKAIIDKSLSLRDRINRLGEEVNDKAGLISLLSAGVALI